MAVGNAAVGTATCTPYILDVTLEWHNVIIMGKCKYVSVLMILAGSRWRLRLTAHVEAGYVFIHIASVEQNNANVVHHLWCYTYTVCKVDIVYQWWANPKSNPEPKILNLWTSNPRSQKANPKSQISKTQIKSNLQVLNLKSFLNLQKLTHYLRK